MGGGARIFNPTAVPEITSCECASCTATPTHTTHERSVFSVHDHLKKTASKNIKTTVFCSPDVSACPLLSWQNGGCVEGVVRWLFMEQGLGRQLLSFGLSSAVILCGLKNTSNSRETSQRKNSYVKFCSQLFLQTLLAWSPENPRAIVGEGLPKYVARSPCTVRAEDGVSPVRPVQHQDLHLRTPGASYTPRRSRCESSVVVLWPITCNEHGHQPKHLFTPDVVSICECGKPHGVCNPVNTPHRFTRVPRGNCIG
jgi:hypothetical protein